MHLMTMKPWTSHLIPTFIKCVAFVSFSQSSYPPPGTQVKLKEALLKTLEDQFVKVGDREVAYINGVLNPTGFGNQGKAPC